jgi:hypothetical protein
VKTYRWRTNNFLGSVVGFVLGGVILLVALAFSLVIFAIVLTVALLALGYAWWRIRSVRVKGGRVIDGESSHEITPRDPE